MKSGIVAVLLLTVAACSATYENHGYIPPQEDLDMITVGVDTRDTIADSIGRPTAFGVLQESGWYYAQSRWRNFAYKAPKVVDRQVVAITFDNDGVVENIERFTLDDGRVIALSRRVTESNVKGIGFLQQLLGNIGNLTPGRLIDGGGTDPRF